MVANLLFFGGIGLSLLLLGAWGLRRAGRLSAVAGWDEEAREHRRQVLRRGCMTCITVGGLFLAVAAATPFLSPPGG